MDPFEAFTDVFLNGEDADVRVQETNLGNLIADAHLEYAQSFDSDVDIAFYNSGAINDSINDDGTENTSITQSDIESVLSFNNDLILLTITGTELEQLIEQSVAVYGDTTTGRFLQVSGLSFSFDPDGQAIAFNNDGSVATDGQRVQSLVYTDSDGNTFTLVEDGNLVAENANNEIRLVTLDFLAEGGDGYPLPEFGENVVNLSNELTLTIKDPVIAFDPTRVDLVNSGIVLQSIDVETGLLGDPLADVPLESIEDSVDLINGTVTVSADLVLSPEFVNEFAGGDISLIGTDFADATIDATFSVVGVDEFEVTGGTTTIDLDLDLVESLGLSVFDIVSPATIVDAEEGIVSFPIFFEEGENKFTFNSDLTVLEETINHQGEAIFQAISDIDFALEGTEQDSLAEYLADLDSPFDIADTPIADDERIQNLNVREDTVIPPEDQTLVGDENPNELSGGDGNDDIDGLAGDDTLLGNRGDDQINGREGNDLAYGGKGDDTISGGEDNDTLFGDLGDDSIFGNSDDDFLNGNRGEDFVDGGEGNDTVYGGKDDDTITGGDGDDYVSGDLGDDMVSGGEGDDTVLGGQDSDQVDGGIGDDLAYGGKDDDTVTGGEGNDTVFGDLGDDVVNGEDGTDVLNGNIGEDIVSGGDGNDTIYGGKDDDQLFGGDGDDLLSGDLGDDIVTGGDGIDTFVIASGNGTDIFSDFVDGVDLIGLAGGLAFGDLSFSNNNEIIASTDNEVLAVLTGVDTTLLTSADFVVV